MIGSCDSNTIFYSYITEKIALEITIVLFWKCVSNLRMTAAIAHQIYIQPKFILHYNCMISLPYLHCTPELLAGWIS